MSNDSTLKAAVLREIAEALRAWGKLGDAKSPETCDAARNALNLATRHLHILMAASITYGRSRPTAQALEWLQEMAVAQGRRDLGEYWGRWSWFTQPHLCGSSVPVRVSDDLEHWAEEYEKAGAVLVLPRDVKADLASGGKRTGGGKGAGKPGKSAAILANVAPQLRRKRKKRPGNVDGEVLTSCRRRCCLCFGLKGVASIKRGQICHLDRDPSNNDKDNLAYLCLKHHDEYDSRTSQSKGLTIEEVRRYRDELYRHLGTHLSD
jgi:hypothetical protein